MKSTAASGWSIFLADDAATLQQAARMAQCLPAGAPCVLYLQGDLGTGKTTLTRGVLRELGEQGAVRSPTYGLIAEYETSAGRVLHLDLYRLRSAEELAALGLADYLSQTWLWLIEWPEQAQGARLPQPDARVFIEVEAAGRLLRISPESAAGRQWLDCLSRDPV
ncbi:MAG: tRNA (adenosine(37)-N6)-threonylcarbamoyltransferase complex ATPase subunit type 1 TsaE [Steroidobacteraceae bacterium]